MKTKELMNKVYEWGYSVLNRNNKIKVLIGETIVAIVYCEHEMSIDTSNDTFDELDEHKKRQLFDLLIEYARTPVKEREESKLFRLRLKGAKHYIHSDSEERGHIYLHKHKDDKFDIGTLKQNPLFENETKSIFSEEEINSIPYTVLQAYDKIEVQNKDEE